MPLSAGVRLLLASRRAGRRVQGQREPLHEYDVVRQVSADRHKNKAHQLVSPNYSNSFVCSVELIFQLQWSQLHFAARPKNDIYLHCLLEYAELSSQPLLSPRIGRNHASVLRVLADSSESRRSEKSTHSCPRGATLCAGSDGVRSRTKCRVDGG